MAKKPKRLRLPRVPVPKPTRPHADTREAIRERILREMMRIQRLGLGEEY